MDLSIDEQRLLAEFRKLAATGQKGLLDYAVMLVKKADQPQGGAATAATTNQCSLKRADERPGSADEPIFTE
jgi:hypothetical protein